MENLIKSAILSVLRANAVEIRNVPPRIINVEVDKYDITKQPFLYASGNWGPGYVSIKNLVGRHFIERKLAMLLAIKIAEKTQEIDFTAGNVTGGVVPAWLVSEFLSILYERNVPFCYIRDTRKKGGQKELLTGNKKNPDIKAGMHGLIVEELVNFAQTTCNGAEAARAEGYNVTHACCILFYENPESIKALEKAGIEMIYLFTLKELLDVAREENFFSLYDIDSYLEFLSIRLDWQDKRGLIPVKSGGTK